MSSPGVPIAGRALLLSNDSAAVGQLTNGMQQFAITADVCSDLATASRLINTRKFEVIVLDFALTKQVAHVLERIRLSPANQNSVTFALVDSRAPEKAPVEPSFIMHKPLTGRSVGRTLKASLGRIIRDYRRYYRCVVTIPVILQLDGETKASCSCQMRNLSEGGLAVNTPVCFKTRTRVKAQFTLPDEPTAFEIDAEVTWCDHKGRAGLQFLSVWPEQKLVLQLWLSHRIEQGLPEHVAQLFQAAH
jgi:PilZ domain